MRVQWLSLLSVVKGITDRSGADFVVDSSCHWRPEDIVYSKAKAFIFSQVCSMNFMQHFSSQWSWGNESHLNSKPSSTLSSSLNLQYSITTLEVSWTLEVSLNISSVLLSNPSASTRFTPMTSSGWLIGSVSLRGVFCWDSLLWLFAS